MSEGPSGLRSNPHHPLPSFLVSPSPRRAQHSHRAGAVRGSSCNEPATRGHSVTVGLYNYLGCECRDLSRQGCRWLVLPQPSPQPLRSGGGGRGGLAPPAGTPQVLQASSTRAAGEPRAVLPKALPRARHQGCLSVLRAQVAKTGHSEAAGRHEQAGGRWARGCPRGAGPTHTRGGLACTQECESTCACTAGT